jgi:hypothetical protein
MTTTPTIPDDVFDQFAAIDKALAHAQAALALNLPREVIEQLVKAHQLSSSLMFRLESDRMQPTATPAQEQAVLL